MIELTCQCGKRFTSKTTGVKGGKRQKYCSRSCAAHFGRPTRYIVCITCGYEFVFQGRTQRLYCADCRRLESNFNSRRYCMRRGRTKHPWVGSGGAQWGENNHQWLGGKAVYTKYKSNYRTRCLRLWPRRCVVCGSEKRIQVHHIDGEPKNCRQANLVPLCLSCHWKVHARKCLYGDKLRARLFALWPNGRTKIAEKSGNPETGIRGEGQGQNLDQPQRLPDEPVKAEYNSGKRPRQSKRLKR